jgi:dihydrofolate reductase
MRKVILECAVSLDGLIEGPNGEYDWCFNDQDYGLTEFVNSIDAIFYGRKSYELFAKGIPESVQDEEERKEWQAMLDKKAYVFSTTLTEVAVNATLIRENVVEQVMNIKNQPGKDIWLFGGARLVTSLFNLGLVDEVHLAVHPIVLGAGKPLFIDITQRVKLELIDTKVYSTGLVRLNYRTAFKES